MIQKITRDTDKRLNNPCKVWSETKVGSNYCTEMCKFKGRAVMTFNKTLLLCKI